MTTMMMMTVILLYCDNIDDNLFFSLCKHTDLRMKLGDSKSLEEVKQINKDITDRVKVIL